MNIGHDCAYYPACAKQEKRRRWSTLMVIGICPDREDGFNRAPRATFKKGVRKELSNFANAGMVNAEFTVPAQIPLLESPKCFRRAGHW